MKRNENIPDQIFSTEKGSWSHSTVTIRLPEILQRVLAENDFSTKILQRLRSLQVEIPDGPIRLLDDDGPERNRWNSYIKPWEGYSWLKAPWFFVEHYFYRRIIGAVDYFQDGLDPFSHQKQEGFWQSKAAIANYGMLLDRWYSKEISSIQLLREGILRSLWGNQADLSLWPAGSEGSPDHENLGGLQEHLLVDQSEDLIRLLTRKSSPGKRVAILLDNAGLELVSDLFFVDILLNQQLVDAVNLLVKAHPTFVSDVISSDVLWTIDSLKRTHIQPVKKVGRRLEKYIQENRLSISEDYFWNSPLAMWDLPVDLHQGLKEYLVLISKGDANYRRLLGDRQWDVSYPFHEVVDYLPLPVTALRALKAELAVGISGDDVKRITDQDPQWMVNGKWAVIHYSGGSTVRF